MLFIDVKIIDSKKEKKTHTHAHTQSDSNIVFPIFDETEYSVDITTRAFKREIIFAWRIDCSFFDGLE